MCMVMGNKELLFGLLLFSKRKLFLESYSDTLIDEK